MVALVSYLALKRFNIFFILLVLFSSGCIPLDTATNQKDTVKAGLSTQGEMLEPSQLVKGDNNSVTVYGRLPSTSRNFDASSTSDVTSEYSSVTQMSLALNLLLFGIAILLLKYGLKGSKTASLTMGLIDGAIASAVSLASSSTDTKEIASHHNLRAELQGLKRYL